jgi:hypothetical protein
MIRKSRYLSGSAVIGLVLLGSTLPAQANHIFFGCGKTCEVDCDDAPYPDCIEAEGGKCILGENIECNSTTIPAVRLRDGMDLDLDGHTITCATGVNCHNGVQMDSGSASKVVNNASSEAVITGGFWAGVECNLLAGSEVTGIRIVNTLVGVDNCKTVKNNVITGLGRNFLTLNFGIQTTGVTASGDEISGNYIADKSWGIYISGTDAVEASGNVLHTSLWTNCGVNLTANSEAIIEGNTFLGVGNAGFGSTRKIICLPNPEPTDTTYSGNICDRDHPDCAACIAGHRCMPFTAPFVP